jgi:NAD(P)-dependent dehydrogenase (short-subunit alcohol dehydrogenase family)
MSPTPASPTLDKVIVITGASSGIGATLAVLAAGRGARVVLAARREAELAAVAARCGAQALAVTTDVTRRADVERLLARAVERFGRVDVWVNNAGRGITRTVSQLTDDDVDEMMRVNLKSALYGMQVALGHFGARGTGQIVNVSSMLGRIPFAPQRSAYNAAKHALNALTSSLRGELRASHPGIVVSTFSPGVVATEFGVHALGGGQDSREFPNAQPVEEAAAVLLDVIEHPRVDEYSRPGMRETVAAYFAAPDMAVAEAGMGAPGPRR